jgi:hypothetical protein
LDQPEEVVVEVEQKPEPVVAAPARITLCDGKYNLYDVCRLYDVGIASLPPREHERWRVTFALAASTQGIWAVVDQAGVYALVAFWRTKNPNVNLAREFPRPDPTGRFAYIGWAWAQGRFVADLRKFLFAKYGKDTDYIAWHDQRLKRKKAQRGRLFTLEIPEQPLTLKDALSRQNGHAPVRR